MPPVEAVLIGAGQRGTDSMGAFARNFPDKLKFVAVAEPISQKQMIIENVAKKLDSETKEQIMPLLEAILQAQPTIKVKSYQQTQITMAMPKNRYEHLGRPQVGQVIQVDLKKI